MPTPSERLLIRLRDMGLEIPDDARLRRTYAGYWQRAAGAWSWCLEDADGIELGIGSQYPVTSLRGRIIVLRLWNDRDLHVDPWLFLSDAQRGDYRQVIEEPVR